jgi:putative inorganic carbon (HCO3(-)) transporter
VWLRCRSAAAWIADHEIWPLGAGVALATFTGRWAPWGLGLLAALWGVRWLGRGRLTVRTPLDWPAVLLALVVLLTFWATTDLEVTFIAVSRLLAGLALAYGLVNWARSPAHVSLLALGMAGLALGLALFASISVALPSGPEAPFLSEDLYELVPILIDDTVNPNMMAGALVMAVPFPLAMVVLAWPDSLPSVSGAVLPVVGWALDGRWFRRLWFAAAALAAAAVLLLTKSRGGWIAGGATVLVLLAHRRRAFLWLVPLALLGLGLFMWRVGPSALLDVVGLGQDVLGWEARIEIWSRAIYIIQDFPFTGVGANTFGTVADVLYPFFLLGPDAEVPHAHNLLLQVAVDLGIPGLVAFLAILFLSLWCAVDSARFCQRRGERALAALAWAGLTSLAGMLVHGLVDATTWSVGRGAFMPWAVIGTLVALARRPGEQAVDNGD